MLMLRTPAPSVVWLAPRWTGKNSTSPKRSPQATYRRPGQWLELSSHRLPEGLTSEPRLDFPRGMQMLAGFVANDPIEATYINVSVDGDGKPLSGTNRYVIHFEKDGLPKVKAFWSVTMYNLKYNLVANPTNRYSLGDRSGMKVDKDGSLTIYVQKDLPGPDKESELATRPRWTVFPHLANVSSCGKISSNQTWQPPKIPAVRRLGRLQAAQRAWIRIVPASARMRRSVHH